MQQQPQRSPAQRRVSQWGRVLTRGLMLLLLAAGPLSHLTTQLSSSTFSWLLDQLPLAFGALVAIASLVSIIYRFRQTGRSQANAPMPSFDGRAVKKVDTSQPARPALTGTNVQPASTSTRFEPLIPTPLLIIGVIGLGLLAGLVVLVFAQGWL